MIDLDILPQFEPVFSCKNREVCLVGGRGSGKSHAIGQFLLIKGLTNRLGVLCLREYQVSIGETVHELLEGIILDNGLDYHYKITQNEIKGNNGTKFIFKGLQKPDSLKSMPKIDYCWIEECATISPKSLMKLIPTVRGGYTEKAGRIFYSLNPENETDPVYDRFFGPNKRTNALIHESNYKDNPYLDEEWISEAEEMRKADPALFDHVYGGKLLLMTDDIVFKNWYTDRLDHTKADGHYCGLDFGFSPSDPCHGISCCFLPNPKDPDKEIIYIFEETVGKEISTDDLPALLLGNRECLDRYGEVHNPVLEFDGLEAAREGNIITADHASPESISYLANRNFNIRKCIKGPGSVNDGIFFLRGYQIVIHPECTNLIDEFRKYRWARDKRDPTIILKDPVDEFNHGIDALRYAIEGVRLNIERPTLAGINHIEIT